LPVEVEGIAAFDDLPALSDFAGVSFRDPGPYLVSTSSLSRGELILHQDGLPLLARRPWGRGSVFFLAMDPQLAPLLDWNGSESVWAEVANRLPNLQSWELGFQNGYAASTAVTSLPSLALPSVLQLVLFLFVYVIVVGPVNYLWVKRRNRRELTWVTVPVLVLIFSTTAYFAGFRLKGNDIVLNKMSVATGQVNGDQMRVQTLIGLYSPRRSQFEMILPADVIAKPFEGEFGRIGGNGNVEGIVRSNQLIISGIRVDVSGTETFIASGYQTMAPVSGRTSLRLENNLIVLDIELYNGSQFDLENSALLLGSDIITLGTLKAGQRIEKSEAIASAPVTSSATSLAPIRPYGPGPPTGSPLTIHAADILGTADYYNDRDAFPRWQLLQSLDSEMFAGPAGASAGRLVARNVATLVAWSDEPQLETDLDGIEHNQLDTTLYLLELPLEQSLIAGDNLRLPISLLNYVLLSESNTYQASIQNLYLRGGWVEFEYQPWPEFQTMTVKELSVVVERRDASSSPTVPEIRFWDWQEEVWHEIRDVDWGSTPVSDWDRYIGAGNAVRIRVQDRASFGTEIAAIYPALAGDLR
jgi:hypothetical protein